MAREDAVARELGQPPDQDLVERVAVRRDERVLRARPGEGADLGPRVHRTQPQAPRRVPELDRAVGGAAARREAAPRVRRPGQRLDGGAVARSSLGRRRASADQTRTALSLPPVRISISESGARLSSARTHTVTPSSRRRVDGVKRPKFDSCLVAPVASASPPGDQRRPQTSLAVGFPARHRRARRDAARPTSHAPVPRAAREDVAPPVQAAHAPAVPVRRRHHDAAADVVQRYFPTRAAHREAPPVRRPRQRGHGVPDADVAELF